MKKTKNTVRIIGGEWRSRRLRIAQNVRPTGDRVKETLFNVLGQHLSGKSCLDLFSGTGALGIEAVSRGATHAVLVENDQQATEEIWRSLERLGTEGRVTLVVSEAVTWLKDCQQLFDIIFLDPPFSIGTELWWQELLDLVSLRLSANGIVYCESNKFLGQSANWRIIKERVAGNTHWSLITPTER